MADEDTKLVMPVAKRTPPAAGMGRRKGSKNKFPAAVKDMILSALDGAGGVEYLQKQANENPVAFMTLVGKVLPMQLTGPDGGAIQVFLHKPA